MKLTKHEITTRILARPPVILPCPYCGFEYLHHDRVTVYSRKEDAVRTLITRISESGAASHEIAPSPAGNPSGRRHGLAIHFWCEGCDGDIELTIAQDKGRTEIRWRPGEDC